jgi:hypothetical protein
MADPTQQFPIIGTTKLYGEEAQVICVGKCVLCHKSTHAVRRLSSPPEEWESDPGDLFLIVSGTRPLSGYVTTLCGMQSAVPIIPSDHGFEPGPVPVISCYECRNDGKKYKPLLDACRRVGGWTITVDP